MRRTFLTSPLIAAAVAALAALTAFAAAPSQAAPVAAPTPTPLQLTCVQIVIDFGSLAPGKKPSNLCVPMTGQRSGKDILAIRARTWGKPMPRYDSQGLLCAIDGIPATGCAHPEHEAHFWSYWHKQGDGAWGFSSAGPASYTVNGTQPAEGWSWSDGPLRPPAHPLYGSICPQGMPIITQPAYPPVPTLP